MKAIVTVGLGFGDEGKGATVDFLTRQMKADLVVRYCGGAQAGHNVELPDGRRHTFSQFGAGTFAGAQTYLGSRVIINPSTLAPEAEHLQRLGVNSPRSLLTAHPNCLVATAYHMAMNRMREASRGDAKHGSCGLGIGETRHYWLRYGRDAVIANDLNHSDQLIDKLALLKDRLTLEMQSLPHHDLAAADSFHEVSPMEEADCLINAFRGVSISSRIPDFQFSIFEGSQGVLLDEYCGFHPYTTWSTVTAQHAIEMLNEAGIGDFRTLGLTRAYATRHGDGPFPTACKAMTRALNDRGNPTNRYQGKIQAGPLDLVLLRYAGECVELDGIAVSHLDELPEEPQVCVRYEGLQRLPRPRQICEQERLTQQLFSSHPVYSKISREEVLERIDRIAPVVIQSNGPTWQDRKATQDLWPTDSPRVLAK